MTATLRRILLATDLSARCDRALDRAVQLAEEWQAELTLLTVIEQRQSPDEVLAWIAGQPDETRERFARRQIAREVAALKVPVTVFVKDGSAADTIRTIAQRSDSDLVVTGIARDEPFGRFWAGGTVGQLVRTISQPILVVRSRVWDRYRKIVVATDFSGPSRHALGQAVRLFPTASLTVLHASGRMRDAGAGLTIREVESRYEQFLTQSGLPGSDRARLHLAVEPGDIENTLPRYVKEHAVDLVLLGTHGRSHLMNVFVGHSAAALAQWVACDALLTRESGARRGE